MITGFWFPMFDLNAPVDPQQAALQAASMALWLRIDMVCLVVSTFFTYL
jgi:hypothetical protein